MDYKNKKSRFVNIDIRPVKSWVDLANYNAHNTRERIPSNIDQRLVLEDPDQKFERRLRESIELEAKAEYLKSLAELTDNKIEAMSIGDGIEIPSKQDPSIRAKRERIETEYKAALDRANNVAKQFRNTKTIEGRLELLNTTLVPCSNVKERLGEIWKEYGLAPDPSEKLVKAFLVAIQISKESQDDPMFRGAGGNLAFAKACWKFLADQFGEANIASLHLHLDETTAHVQGIITPVVIKPIKVAGSQTKVEMPRLCYKEFFGETRIVPEAINPKNGKPKTHSGRQKLRELHTDLANHMANFGLIRGRMQFLKSDRSLHPEVHEAYESQEEATEAGEKIIKDTLKAAVDGLIKESEQRFVEQVPLMTKLLNGSKKQRERGLELAGQLHSDLANAILGLAPELQGKLAAQFTDSFWQKAENERLKKELEAKEKAFLPLTQKIAKTETGEEITQQLDPDLIKLLIERMQPISDALFEKQIEEEEKRKAEKERLAEMLKQRKEDEADLQELRMKREHKKWIEEQNQKPKSGTTETHPQDRDPSDAPKGKGLDDTAKGIDQQNT